VAKSKVLLIENEQNFYRYIKNNLEATGRFEVNFAKNAATGIKFTKKYKPDVVLLDILIPGEDGFDILKLLKGDIKTRIVPVVMLAGKMKQQYKEKAMRLYSEDCILKSTEPRALIAKIDAILNRQKGIF